MEPRDCVVLVSCSSQKDSSPAPAKSLYISPRFREARKFAEQWGAKWFIVSAKHGLVDPDEVLDPYDANLETFSARQRKAWREWVISKFAAKDLAGKSVVLLASGAYRDELHVEFQKRRIAASYPIYDLPQGADVAILSRVNKDPKRFRDYVRFYDLLSRLARMPGQMTPFGNLAGREVAKAGVYFFFDPREPTRFYNGETLRVVRVGTHGVSKGSKSTLWQRLRTHRGNDSGSGNHRSSIFRLHVGDALLASQGHTISTWGVGDNADSDTCKSEQGLEVEVSRYLRGLIVAYLPILDAPSADSDRSYIEKNAISLLTGGGPIDVQSSEWLGNHSPALAIKDSGLWNVNYIGDSYDPHFLSVLRALIERYEQNFISDQSLAPLNWRIHMQRGAVGQQELF